MSHDPSDAGEFISGGGLLNPTKTYKDMDDKREEEAKKKAKQAKQRAAEKARAEERAKEEAKKKAENRQRENRAGGSAATILTGAGGLQSESGSNKRTLMGA